MLNQRLSTMELKHFEYNDFISDAADISQTIKDKVPQYV